MAQTFVPTNTLSQSRSMLQIPYSAADTSFAATQYSDQALAEVVGNFLVFNANGQVDGVRSSQAMNEINNIAVYMLDSDVPAGANTNIWRTTLINWTTTLAARLSYRLAHFGF